MESVLECGCKCTLTLMGCQRTRGILGDTPQAHLQIYPPVCQLTPTHSEIRGLQQEFHPEAGALSVIHHIQPDLNLPQTQAAEVDRSAQLPSLHSLNLYPSNDA